MGFILFTDKPERQHRYPSSVDAADCAARFPIAVPDYAYCTAADTHILPDSAGGKYPVSRVVGTADAPAFPAASTAGAGSVEGRKDIAWQEAMVSWSKIELST
jgi:hypothetical protein